MGRAGNADGHAGAAGDGTLILFLERISTHRNSYAPRVEPASSRKGNSRRASGLPFYRQESAYFFEEKTVLTWLMVTTILSWRTLPQAPDDVDRTQSPHVQLMTPALSL